MIAQKHSEIAKLIIDLMTTKLWAHYLVEASTDQYHTYNYFYWVPPVVAHDLLEYQFSDNFRNEFLKKYAGQKVINPDIPAFQKFGCGLVVVDELLKFYGTNMSHHHGENMKLHWSELQKTQRLFFR